MSSRINRYCHRHRILIVIKKGIKKDMMARVRREDQRYNRQPSSQQQHKQMVSRTFPQEFCLDEPERVDSPDADALVRVRLSLVGLQSVGGNVSRQSSARSSACDDELLDGLHSDPYASVIEKLRLQLSDCLPGVDEEMISKAVIYAFSTNCSPTSKSEAGFDKYQMEVDLICEAHRWVLQYYRNRDERAEQEFFQECLNKIFLEIQNHHISSCSRALGILISVATILGIEIDDAFYVPQDTIILQGLPTDLTKNKLLERLSQYGVVRAVAIASVDKSGFAYCRFQEEASANRVMVNQSFLAMDGIYPKVTMLSESFYRNFTLTKVIEHRQDCERGDFADIFGTVVNEDIAASPVSVAKEVGTSTKEKKSGYTWRTPSFRFLP